MFTAKSGAAPTIRPSLDGGNETTRNGILPKIQTQRRNLRNNDAKEAIGAEAIDAAQEKRQERQAELDRKREELSNAMNDTRERCDDALSVAEKLGKCGFDEGPHVLSLNQLQKSYQELSL